MLPHNEFLGGGLLLMGTGSLLALLRNIPAKLSRWVKLRLTYEVEIINSDPLFGYVVSWLDRQEYTKRARSIIATFLLRGDTHLMLSPAPGNHFFMYNGKPIWLYRKRDDSPGNDVMKLVMKTEHIYIRVLGRDQATIRTLLDEIVTTGMEDFKGNPQIYTVCWDGWRQTTIVPHRSLDSVVLPEIRDIMTDIELFLEGKELYTSLGIPWHRGYLFYGIPGSGKTSLVKALAHHFKRDLYVFDLASKALTDDKMLSLMGCVPETGFVLIEDVDCVFPNRKKTAEDVNSLTMTGLLNALDGIRTPEGCLLFLTTNCVDTIDAALLRPGRVDLKVEFGNATEWQVEQMRAKIAPDYAQGIEHLIGKSMAEVQQELLRCKNAAAVY